MKPVDFLTNGEHSRSIEKHICTWCKKEAMAFRDLLSKKEYKISGLRQEFQDKTFGG